VAYKVNPPGFAQAGYETISTSDDVVHSQVIQAGTFNFVRIYEAGHEVPFYQPELALAIARKDIATGQLDITAITRPRRVCFAREIKLFNSSHHLLDLNTIRLQENWKRRRAPPGFLVERGHCGG
jgi:hypothetical protein